MRRENADLSNEITVKFCKDVILKFEEKILNTFQFFPFYSLPYPKGEGGGYRREKLVPKIRSLKG